MNKSPHILSAASNLLGFCLVVLTSIKISHFSHATIIDDVTGLSAVLLVLSCIISFLSIRAAQGKHANLLEHIAGYIFLAGLLCIAGTIILVSFNLFK